MNQKIKPPFFAFLLVILVCGPDSSAITQNNKSAHIHPVMRTIEDTLAIHQYGQKIAGLLEKSDWPTIVGEIHAIHMPPNWKEMIKPSFEAYFGYELSVEVIPFDSLPGYQLKWLNKAPKEILAKTKWAIRLSYDNSTKDETDKGKLELAVYEQDGVCSILLVGNQ